MLHSLATTAANSKDLFSNHSQQATNVTLYLIGAVFVIVLVIMMVFAIVGTWQIYTKAGEKGWKSLIPIYNNWIFLRLGGQSSWWAILTIFPILNLITSVMLAIAAYNIGLKFHKSGSFVIVYLLFSPIWAIMLGYGENNTWHDDNDASSNFPNTTPIPPLPPRENTF